MTIRAESKNVQCMVFYFEIDLVGLAIDDIQQLLTLKFEYLSTVAADEVIVRFESITLFIECLIITKLMTLYQAALYEYVEGIVDRSSAHPI